MIYIRLVLVKMKTYNNRILKQLLNKKNCITCKWSSYNRGFNYAYPDSSCLNSECEHYGIVYNREIYNMDCDNYVYYNAKVG